MGCCHRLEGVENKCVETDDVLMKQVLIIFFLLFILIS